MKMVINSKHKDFKQIKEDSNTKIEKLELNPKDEVKIFS